MLELACFMEPITCLPSIFDVDPWLLNCLNGTINLRTGELQQHNPADMLTKLCPVNYDPDATFDMWDEFLETATDGNQEVQKYLQVAIGYSLTGKTDEEKLFFIHGGAATGKSTFTEAIKATMGDYATTADFETFLRRQVGSIRNDIARLHGARFVASTEVDQGQRLAEGLVKMLTGGDTIAARFLYSESFNFLPQLKLWLAANHAPKIRDDDSAIWRRINRVPFTHHILKEKRDPRIKNTLRNPDVAGPAILVWAVRGCLIWQKEGLIVPDIIETATEEYR